MVTSHPSRCAASSTPERTCRSRGVPRGRVSLALALLCSAAAAQSFSVKASALEGTDPYGSPLAKCSQSGGTLATVACKDTWWGPYACDGFSSAGMASGHVQLTNDFAATASFKVSACSTGMGGSGSAQWADDLWIAGPPGTLRMTWRLDATHALGADHLVKDQVALALSLEGVATTTWSFDSGTVFPQWVTIERSFTNWSLTNELACSATLSTILYGSSSGCSPALGLHAEAVLESVEIVGGDGLPAPNQGALHVVGSQGTVYFPFDGAPPARRLYVDGAAQGLDNGLSWQHAYTRLQDAFDAAIAPPVLGPAEIWVAQGSYRPDLGGGRTEGSNGYSFLLNDRVSVYGGFAGGEPSLEERDPNAHPAVMTGLLAGGARSLHVVKADSCQDAVLDGFTVRDGDAYWAGNQANAYAGGLVALNTLGSAKATRFEVRHVRFLDNLGTTCGGVASYGTACYPVFRNCLFDGNASHAQQVAHLDQPPGIGYGSMKVYGCTFTPSNATSVRGRLAVVDGCTFETVSPWSDWTVPNKDSKGGATLSVRNSIFVRNTSAAQAISVSGALDPDMIQEIQVDHCLFDKSKPTAATITYGAGNLVATPGFVDPAAGDYRLLASSPAVDAGDPADGPVAGAPAALDAFGTPRYLDGDANKGLRVDMGAFERSRAYLAAAVVPAGKDLAIDLSVTGQDGLPVLLLASTSAGDAALGGYGALLVGGEDPITVVPLGPLPVSIAGVPWPAALPPLTVFLQAAAVDPLTGIGNLGNRQVLQLP